MPKRKPAVLYLTVRAVVRRDLPANTVALLLQRAIREKDPHVSGLQIRGIDWAKGKSQGSTDETGDVRKALRDLRGPLLAGQFKLRFAVVRPEPGKRSPVVPGVKRYATGQGYYRHRDARGRFSTAEAWRAQRERYSAEEEGLLDQMRVTDYVGVELEEGAEVELTVTYKESA